MSIGATDSGGASRSESVKAGGGGGSGAGGGAASAVSRAAPAFATSSRTSPWRACESNGFVTMASLPTRSARARSNGSNVPVRRTTGTKAPPGRCFTASQTS